MFENGVAKNIEIKYVLIVTVSVRVATFAVYALELKYIYF